MRIINRPQTDPYFNLATEEYLLKNVEDDCFMVWQNEPCIVIGKHQNVFAEINYPYVIENKIPVIRRISGGGTVFHDPGNLNFSFIATGEREKLVDFRKFTQPIIDYLNSRGIAAKFEGKNDIRVNGLKVSGNAEHVFKNKVLHHGTLLFSADLEGLKKAIKPVNGKFDDKAVQSVRSNVSNLTDLFAEKITIHQFRNELVQFVKKDFDSIVEYHLSKQDILEIEKLAREKYKTWDWNYGYSPSSIFLKQIFFGNKKYTLQFEIQNGIVQKVTSDSYNKFLHELFRYFIGQRFDLRALQNEVHDEMISQTALKNLEFLISEIFS